MITDEISQDLSTAIGLACAFGLDGIEIRSVWNKGPHELTPDDVARIKEMAGAAGLAVCSVAPPFFKCELSEKETVEKHLDILKKSCDVANALGAPVVRGFAFWRHGPLEEVKTDVVRCLGWAADIMEDEGLTLGMENEYDTCNCNVRRTLELIDEVGSPNLKLLFDPGNDVYDPEGEPPWPDAYTLAKDRMVHMHLKDPGKDAETGKIRALPIGEGDIHARELMAALVRDGYSGYISLETHYRREPLPEELMALPKGEDFSAGGYVASRECLERWFAMLGKPVNPRPAPAV